MRITSQPSTDFTVQQKASANPGAAVTPAETKPVTINEQSIEASVTVTKLAQENVTDQETLKEKLLPAIDTMNEILETTQKSSKFVLHEGLDKYYVRLIDAQTEEVIKEIPPQRLLDAFYEMQKMAGMIVDEKI